MIMKGLITSVLAAGVFCFVASSSAAPIDPLCLVPTASTPPGLLGPKTHVAVFDLSKKATEWRALFFTGDSKIGRSILLTLNASYLVENAKATNDAWKEYEERIGQEPTAETVLGEDLRRAQAKGDLAEKAAHTKYDEALGAIPSDIDEAARLRLIEEAVKARREAMAQAKALHEKERKEAQARADKTISIARQDLAKKDVGRIDGIDAGASGLTTENAIRLQAAWDCVNNSRLLAENRFVGTAGDPVAVFSFYRGDRTKRPTVEGKEQARASRIEQDLATLGKLLLSGALPANTLRSDEPIPIRTVFLAKDMYTLTEKRGTLSLTATPTEPKGSAAAPPKEGLVQIAEAVNKVAVAVSTQRTTPVSQPANDAAKGGPVSASVTTGPREHWFLSANANIRKYEDLAFDEASKTFVPSAKAPSFLLGVNYFLGDMASPRSNGLFLSLLVEPSRKPTGAIGPGIGLRLRSLKKSFLELDGFSPFAGYIRVAGESAAGQPTAPTEWRWVFGITFNLDKASDWLKK